MLTRTVNNCIPQNVHTVHIVHTMYIPEVFGDGVLSDKERLFDGGKVTVTAWNARRRFVRVFNNLWKRGRQWTVIWKLLVVS